MSAEQPREESGRNVDQVALISVCKQNSVLLQTARAHVSSTNEASMKYARLLFDSGSQLSYINPTARDELQLPTVGKQQVALKVFGNAESIKTLDVVTFAVKCRNGVCTYVTALVSEICH